MTLDEARNLKIGEKVMTKMHGYELEVHGLHEHISWTNGKTTIYYGADMDEESATAIAEKIEEQFPEVEVEVQFGGQPIYYYLISVE